MQHPWNMKRRTWLNTAAALSLPTLPAWAHAQSDLVRLVVPFPAGGATDVIARALAPALGKELNRNVIVENKVGASGTVAMRQLQSSPATTETYAVYLTLTLLGFVLAGQQPELNKLTPISQLYEQYTITAVNPAVPGFEQVHTIKDLIALVKSRGEPLQYASSAVGSTGHLTMEWLANLSGMKLQHIAYKGGAPAVADVLGGHVGMIVTDTTVIGPHVRAGKVRPIAINYPKRVDEFAQVPTIGEQGFAQLSAVPWATLVGPPNMPAERTAQLSAAVQRALADPQLVAKMHELTVFPHASNPEQTKALMERDLKLWRKVIEDNRISV